MEFYNTKIFSYHISLIRKYDFEHGAKNYNISSNTIRLTTYTTTRVLVILFDLFHDLQYVLRFYVSFNTTSM